MADGNLTEVAVQLGKMVEHPDQSQPNPGLRADESPCIVHILHILSFQDASPQYQITFYSQVASGHIDRNNDAIHIQEEMYLSFPVYAIAALKLFYSTRSPEQ